MTTTRVEEALGRLGDLPVPVRKWQIETGSDATGDDAVWVWAVLDDKDLDWNNTEAIRLTVEDAVKRAANGQDPWVYVRFRAASEV